MAAADETMPDRVMIFAAGAPLAADVEETCLRLRLPVVAAIRNRPGAVFTLESTRLIEADALPHDVLGIPFVCALFTPGNRGAAVAEAVRLGLRAAAPLIDPSAIVARSAQWGEGCYVNAGVLVGAACRFGRFVLLNRGASIGHHAVVGDHVSIGPGAVLAGEIVVGDAVLIGVGAVVCPGVRIGSGAVIAPGAVVRRDVPAAMLVAGNPARVVGGKPR